MVKWLNCIEAQLSNQRLAQPTAKTINKLSKSGLTDDLQIKSKASDNLKMSIAIERNRHYMGSWIFINKLTFCKWNLHWNNNCFWIKWMQQMQRMKRCIVSPSRWLLTFHLTLFDVVFVIKPTWNKTWWKSHSFQMLMFASHTEVDGKWKLNVQMHQLERNSSKRSVNYLHKINDVMKNLKFI